MKTRVSSTLAGALGVELIVVLVLLLLLVLVLVLAGVAYRRRSQRDNLKGASPPPCIPSIPSILHHSFLVIACHSHCVEFPMERRQRAS